MIDFEKLGRQLAEEFIVEMEKKNPVVIPDHPPYPDYHKK